MTSGKDNYLGTALCAKLAHDSSNVKLHCMFTDV